MATNVPPMVRGTVIFTRSFNPHDIVRLIKSRRVSVLVCVPKILDVLREHVVRAFPEAAGAAAGRHLDSRPLVALPPRALGARAEVLGVRRRRGAAAARPRGVLAPHGVRGDPGLRPDRDGADRHAEPSVQDEQGVGRDADRRRRGPHRRRRRDPGARRERHERVLTKRHGARSPTSPGRQSPGRRRRVAAHGRHRRARRRRAACSSRAARRK